MTFRPFSFKLIYALILFCILMPGSGAAHSGLNAPDRSGDNFSHDIVVQLAGELAREPFRELPKAPEILSQMDYSTYRQINFKPDEAVWGGSPTKFSVQLFAPGFLFNDLVDIEVVENGQVFPLRISETSFSVPDESLGRVLADLGKFTGFRLHYPINRHDYQDEFIVFQGASYFRAVSKGQVYGLSMRGLAIDVAQPTGEEHPVFRNFWIERPSSYQNSIVIHALLDSKSVTGAYRFGIYPGSPTWVDVDVVLFPRRDIQHVGLAPLTSMYMHGPLNPSRIPDYRPAVNDSEGLAMMRGNGERLWRPLNNPRTLQVSAFMDVNPRGFGLIQRNRQFDYYQDLEAHYHRRPSAWVEPLGDWGNGHVELIEIPSDSEANDNIVAYWKPAEGLKNGQPFSYSYRLTWPEDEPLMNSRTRIVRSAGGTKLFTDKKEVVIDYSHLASEEIDNINVEASINNGAILEARLQPNPYTEGARVFVNFTSENAQTAELRIRLTRDEKPVAATWLYRWIN